MIEFAKSTFSQFKIFNTTGFGWDYFQITTVDMQCYKKNEKKAGNVIRLKCKLTRKSNYIYVQYVSLKSVSNLLTLRAMQCNLSHKWI